MGRTLTLSANFLTFFYHFALLMTSCSNVSTFLGRSNAIFGGVLGTHLFTAAIVCWHTTTQNSTTRVYPLFVAVFLVAVAV